MAAILFRVWRVIFSQDHIGPLRMSIAVWLAFAVQCVGQSTASCPILPTLASVKTGWSEELGYKAQNTIVIGYWNQGKKPIRGAEFKLFMLDAVGNRYPAQKLRIAQRTVQPQKGDVVEFENEEEKLALGTVWDLIQGVEVRVIRVMYSDSNLNVWTPLKEAQCSRRFMNDEYDTAIARRNKEFCGHDKPPIGKSAEYLAGWKSMHDAICGEHK